MIIKVFEFSAAAGSASVNVMPSQFNPVPADGVLDIWAVLDSGIAGLTAPPTISVQLGGATESTPVVTSSVTGDPNAIQTAGNFPDPVNNPVCRGLAVRQGTNTSLNLAGGTGAAATGRFRVQFRTAQEVASGAGL